MKKPVSIFLFVFFSTCLWGQEEQQTEKRLKVFVDCVNAYCDFRFIRTEINIVDFMLDNQAADLHILVTDHSTGSGGQQYQMIFFGQNQFKNRIDTLWFNTDPNATDFERRDQLVKYLKLGLVPFIARTSSVKGVDISMKQESSVTDNSISETKDPWNYWVFRINSSGSLNLDEVYKESSIRGGISANRVTDEIKFGFELQGGKNRSQFEYEDDNGVLEKYVVKNNNYELSQYLIKSISQHWSWGYELNFSRNTFSNNRSRKLIRSGVEYNIFPYSQVNTKSFTFAYIVDARRSSYLDTTLYDKIKETLWGHSLETKVRVNQKWGNLYFGGEYHNFFHNWKFLNLEVFVAMEMRITGGLSLNIHTQAELIRDQIYLPKEGATAQEVLTRRRQLASGYRFSTYFGINYRFGSKLNNFVNPRFD